MISQFSIRNLPFFSTILRLAEQFLLITEHTGTEILHGLLDKDPVNLFNVFHILSIKLTYPLFGNGQGNVIFLFSRYPFSN